MYIVDTNVLIRAYNHDFRPDIDPDNFWEWLNDLFVKGMLIVPESVIVEIEVGSDDLSPFLKTLPALKIVDTIDAMLEIPNVMKAYGVLTETDLELLNLGADPFIIAHALVENGIVVSNEISKPKVTAPKNKQIPDICSKVGISCISFSRFIWDIFSSNSSNRKPGNE